MPLVLSLAASDKLWASGPEGLYHYRYTEDYYNEGTLDVVLQPQQQLYCCAAVGKQVLVGGLPYGIAYSPDEGAAWHAARLDGIDAPPLCLAPDPRAAETGVILAGTAGAGVLRSLDWGRSWTPANFGLQDTTVMALAWAPPAPPETWPRWALVLAATEEGLYRSPNGGRGWRRAAGVRGVFQALAVEPAGRIVLAGAEAAGLWRSADAGRTFEPVSAAPQQVNALAATPTGWVLSSNDGLWRSADGLAWEPIPGSRPAFVLLADMDRLWTGTESGVECYIKI